MKPITTPYFEPIAPEHREAVESYTTRYGHYSDFVFTSLFAWNTDGSTAISFLHDNLVIRQPSYLDGLPCYSILGSTNMDSCMHTLLELTDHLSFVPELSITSLVNQNDFLVEEDVDNHDYVYDLSLHAAFKGKGYKHVREHRNKFFREVSNIDDLVTIVSQSMETVKGEALLQLFDDWADHRDQPADNAAQERTAISRLLTGDISPNLLIIETALAGSPAAFSIYECLTDDYAILHFAKARRVHRAFSAYLVQRDAEILMSVGCRLVNWEQDLGIPGLRAHKSAYQPVEMLRKYTVRRASRLNG